MYANSSVFFAPFPLFYLRIVQVYRAIFEQNLELVAYTYIFFIYFFALTEEYTSIILGIKLCFCTYYFVLFFKCLVCSKLKPP